MPRASRKIRPSVVLLAALAAGCAGARATPAPGRDPRDARGEHLYRVSCAGCHRLREPSELTAEGWRAAVKEHGEDADVSPGEAALIREFLVRHAAGARGQGVNAPASLASRR